MRVLFHYTHKETLGHTTRSIALASAIGRHGADVLILQGGVPQPFVRVPEGCRSVDIPFPFDNRTSFQAHTAPVSSNNRAQFILKTAAEFSPDVFITEFFPFGRLAYMPELLPTLRYLRTKNTRIIASIGYPLLIDLDRLADTTFAALHRAVFAFYDSFLIHTPKDLETSYIRNTIRQPEWTNAYDTVMKNIKERTVYTGYVFPEDMLTGGTNLPVEKGIKTLVVSRGGGAVYPKIVTCAIEAQRSIKDIRTIIACGPATSEKEMALFESSLTDEDRKRVVLARRIDNLGEHLKHCAVSVSLCGYNTSVQLMRYGTPSVIVPYQNTNYKMPTNDQIARAEIFKEHFSSPVLHHDAMTGQSLTAAIEELLGKPRPKPAASKWFNGADASARHIVK
ncbi:MAG: hypothetical protein KA403_04545 [Candidatus Omnitrophica bacterium]|nr:hypothetical protein [Candidatus Omnitrophota bacterium]